MTSGLRRIPTVEAPPPAALAALARRVVQLVAVIAIANVLVLAVETLLVIPLEVPSGSMRPALHSGDRVVVDKRVGLDELRRGDLVVFNVSLDAGRGYAWQDVRPSSEGSDVGDLPDTTGEGGTRGWFPVRGSANSHLVVKRVIGLPGELIEARDHVVAIDRTTRLAEPYASWSGEPSGFGQVRLHEHEIWVMGDERDDSRDSRNYGPVPASAIEGRVVWRYWPWARRGTVR